MRFSCEMLSVKPGEAIAAYPNKLKMYVDNGGLVYITVEAIHDGHQISSTVIVERAVFAHHVKGSGVLS